MSCCMKKKKCKSQNGTPMNNQNGQISPSMVQSAQLRNATADNIFQPAPQKPQLAQQSQQETIEKLNQLEYLTKIGMSTRLKRLSEANASNVQVVSQIFLDSLPQKPTMKNLLLHQYQYNKQNSTMSNNTGTSGCMTTMTEYSDSEFDEINRDTKKQVHDDLGIIDTSIIPMSPANDAPYMNSIPMPPKQKNYRPRKPVLILDMDETMIHSQYEYNQYVVKQVQIPVTPETQYLQIDPTQSYIRLFLCVRHYLYEFLRDMIQFYEIYVWTLGVQQYADVILDYIEQRMNQLYGIRRCFKKRFYQHHCQDTIKNLDMLGVDMKKCIIVDDSQESFQLHQVNAIQIPQFLGQKDNCLKQLSEFLADQSRKDDLRQDLKIYWE